MTEGRELDSATFQSSQQLYPRTVLNRALYLWLTRLLQALSPSHQRHTHPPSRGCAPPQCSWHSAGSYLDVLLTRRQLSGDPVNALHNEGGGSLKVLLQVVSWRK